MDYRVEYNENRTMAILVEEDAPRLEATYKCRACGRTTHVAPGLGDTCKVCGLVDFRYIPPAAATELPENKWCPACKHYTRVETVDKNLRCMDVDCGYISEDDEEAPALKIGQKVRSMRKPEVVGKIFGFADNKTEVYIRDEEGRTGCWEAEDCVPVITQADITRAERRTAEQYGDIPKFITVYENQKVLNHGTVEEFEEAAASGQMLSISGLAEAIQREKK